MTEPMHQPSSGRLLTRRQALWGAAGIAGVAAAGVVGLSVAPQVRRQLGLGPDPYIPEAPEGQVQLERVQSDARGQEVDL